MKKIYFFLVLMVFSTTSFAGSLFDSRCYFDIRFAADAEVIRGSIVNRYGFITPLFYRVYPGFVAMTFESIRFNSDGTQLKINVVLPRYYASCIFK